MEKQNNMKEQVVWLAGLPLLLHYSVNSLCAMESQADLPLDELMNHPFSAELPVLDGMGRGRTGHRTPAKGRHAGRGHRTLRRQPAGFRPAGRLRNHYVTVRQAATGVSSPRGRVCA